MKKQIKITSVEEALSKAENTLYLSGWRWVSAKALTEFAKYLENKAKFEGKQFWIVSTSVHKVQKMKTIGVGFKQEKIEEGKPEKLISGTFGQHFSCVIGDMYYSFNTDDNPFFHDGGTYDLIPVKDEKINKFVYYLSNWNVSPTYETTEWEKVLETMKQFKYQLSRHVAHKGEIRPQKEDVGYTTIYTL